MNFWQHRNLPGGPHHAAPAGYVGVRFDTSVSRGAISDSSEVSGMAPRETGNPSAATQSEAATTRQTEPNTGETNQAETKPAKPGRITSLDVGRGWFLIMSVTSAAWLLPRPDWLIHAPWIGIRYYDMIFPLFVTLSGIGLAFAYHNRVSFKVTLRRIVVLVVVGLLYNGVSSGQWDPATFRFTGPLQVYAVIVAIIATCHLFARNWMAWAGITAGVAVLQTGLLTWWAGTCPSGVLSPSCNPSGMWDRALLGAHMYYGGFLGHDPEGLVAITGALLTAAAGTTAGHLALSSRRLGWKTGPVKLLALAAAMSVFGLILNIWVPAFKRLWTPSFSLIAGAVGVLIFAVAFLCFDVPLRSGNSRIRERIAWPFTALGRNSLLVYFGSHLAIDVLNRLGPEPGLAWRIAAKLGDTLGAPYRFIFLNMVAWWALALLLHWRKIYIHA